MNLDVWVGLKILTIKRKRSIGYSISLFGDSNNIIIGFQCFYSAVKAFMFDLKHLLRLGGGGSKNGLTSFSHIFSI